MGDRKNPIKFGPEWLRNLAHEPANTGAHGGPRDMGAAATTASGVNSPRPHAVNHSSSSPKVLLARLRYGREEMLALYDRQTAEAPALLKTNDTLYQPRGKPPYALNNSFEEDTRDSVSRQPPAPGLLSPSDRYTGASRGRSVSLNDTKPRVIQLSDLRGGRARGYMRPNPALQQRGWHGRVGGAYSGIPDDDPNQPLRPWSNNNHQTSPGQRPNNGEQPDWQTKQAQYRMKRQTSTNWRQQQGRDEGEEWRSSDSARRPQEKWADWGWQQEAGGRPTQDKQWHTNRRTWVGGESSEDALPEWAVDNAEACAGTFDSSGAFHGYSNDDSNLPKNQDTHYPLMKSHTHGSFVRTKTAEEGSEEWWASEKAKKLSPKRFDASEIQFKKPLSPNNADEKSNSNTATPKNVGPNDTVTHNQNPFPKRTYQTIAAGGDRKPKENKPPAKTRSKTEDETSPETKPTVSEPENYNKTDEAKNKEKIFESRSNNDKPIEKGNIQSVILTSNNTLRQKHQNITVTPTETPKRQAKLMSYLETVNQPRQIESDVGEFENRKDAESNKIVEDILKMSLEDGIPSATINQLLTSHSNSSMNSLAQAAYNTMHMRMAGGLQGLGMNSQNMQNAPLSTGMQSPEAYNGMMQPMCITNSMLNASLGLPLPDSNTGLPQGIPQSLSNTGLTNQNTLASGLQGMGGGNLQQAGIQQPGLQGTGMQSSQMSSLQGLHMQGLQGFGIQPTASIQNNLSGMPNNNNMQGTGPGLQSTTNPMSGVANSALFNNIPHANNLPNTGGDTVQALHRFQQYPATQSQSFGNMFGVNLLNRPPPVNMAMKQSMTDQWYYEDPNKTIQGPFSSKDMYNWYRAGFFSPTLMVRRERDAVMSPLGSYGPLPFGPIDLLTPFSMGGGYDLLPQQSHENLMNQQPGLGVDGLPCKGPFRQTLQLAPNVQYKPRSASNIRTQAAVKSCGPIIRPRLELHTQTQTPLQLVQNNEVQSLWEQPANNAPAPDMMWMPMNNNNPRNDSSANPLRYWNIEGTDVAAAPLMPESIKTEEEILAQMRAAQAQGPTSPLSFFAESPIAPQEAEANNTNARLNINQLQKLIQKDAVAVAAAAASDTVETESQAPEKTTKSIESPAVKGIKTTEVKTAKEVNKTENNKQKNKEIKPKSKKAKDDKKEEPEVKAKEEEIKIEKRSAEPSPSPKSKKEDKISKKDLDKEKKEWIKEGFTIVKGAEKTKDKDSKKKAEEAKAAEETERKKKEEEKLAAEEKKRQLEAIKKQETQIQTAATRQAAESVSKKAPWSASTQSQPSSRDGPTLAEIQRLEREKKLEQMKEQQQMMQMIAQKEAAALAKEQELQTGLGWAKKPNTAAPSPTLAEIQAEARKQAAAAAAAAAAVAAAAPREEEPTPPPANTLPWANIHNGGGFWDSPNPEPVKPVAKQPEPKPEPKNKKKVTVMAPPKQENTPSVEFDLWCNNMLVSWRDTGIDVPTFVSFLRDIESPYEVKDYVKCYLGDSREAGDFARQFLEKRSRLMRVGMVTPSDDLCSPAVAVNPRTNSGSDHADLKAKGKKTKKNKMLKVDARNILGFSVTASEDRINVGDIDTV